MLALAAARTRSTNLLITFVFTLLIVFPGSVFASTDSNCRDVALIFARGSGQNQSSDYINDPLGDDFKFAEKESYAFFKNHADHLNNDFPHISYKAVSVHDFPGKYDPVGYKSVGVGLGNIPNTANADASWVPGDYQDSVEHGIAETVGYIKDQIASCPNQYLMIGGYSQGAQVMGEALFRLTEHEQSKILGVGFFGDPKYIGSTNGVSFPWRRGEATNKDTGMLEPRIPYVPQSIEHRTLSWCNRNDIVCAGWSAFRKNSTHSSYSENPIRYAVNELVSIATPQLLALERNQGGINSDVPTTQLSKADRDRERDVMFVFNDNSNTDVLNTFRYYLDPTLDQFVRNFTGTRFAAKSFGEHDYGFSAPRVDNVQSFLPYTGFNPSNPTLTSSNLTKSFAAKYSFAQPIIGGGDIEDPHQLALERAVVSTGWRDDPNVERNIVLITDRPPKDPYEYNICNGTIRQWLRYPDIDGYKNCYTNYHREIWQKVLLPEACETILKVITEPTCINPLMAPHYVQMNKRSLADEIKLAQAYNTKITVVIPHKFDPQIHAGNKLSDPAVRDKLKNLAYATGGTFIYYDQRMAYNSTLLYDTLWQVFTKQPRSLDAVANGNDTAKTLGLQTHIPVILDVSRSGVVAQSYKWDFDDNGTWDQITPGPVTEHEFGSPGQGLFRVQALTSGGIVLAETRQIYTVTVSEETAPVQPTLPAGINAAQQADGTTLITWLPEGSNQLIVFDPVSNLPIGSSPISNGSLTLPTSYESLVIRVISENAASDPSTLPVSPYIAPPPVIEEDEIPPEIVIDELPDNEPPQLAPVPSPTITEPPIIQITDPILPAADEPLQPAPDPSLPSTPEQPVLQAPVPAPPTQVVDIITEDTPVLVTPTTRPIAQVAVVSTKPVIETSQAQIIPAVTSPEMADSLTNIPKVESASVSKPPAPDIKVATQAPQNSAAKKTFPWLLILIIVTILLTIALTARLARKKKSIN